MIKINSLSEIGDGKCVLLGQIQGGSMRGEGGCMLPPFSSEKANKYSQKWGGGSI